MNLSKAEDLIKESFTSLKRSKFIESDVEMNKNTVLLGQNSVLDSMSFVNFITDLEDRIVDHTGEEFFLVLNNLHEFNEDNPHLNVETLVNYLAETVKA